MSSPLGKAEFKHVPVNQLKIDSKIVSETTITEELDESLSSRGILSPVIVTEDYRVIDGAKRVKWAQRMGIKEVPTLIVPLICKDDASCKAVRFLLNNVRGSSVSRQEMVNLVWKLIMDYMVSLNENVRSSTARELLNGTIPNSIVGWLKEKYGLPSATSKDYIRVLLTTGAFRDYLKSLVTPITVTETAPAPEKAVAVAEVPVPTPKPAVAKPPEKPEAKPAVTQPPPPPQPVSQPPSEVEIEEKLPSTRVADVLLKIKDESVRDEVLNALRQGKITARDILQAYKLAPTTEEFEKIAAKLAKGAEVLGELRRIARGEGEGGGGEGFVALGSSIFKHITEVVVTADLPYIVDAVKATSLPENLQDVVRFFYEVGARLCKALADDARIQPQECRETFDEVMKAIS
jgi:ParB-like chromosome segregation protein Spo0J